MKKYLIPVVLTILWNTHAFCATMENTKNGTATIRAVFTYLGKTSTTYTPVVKCTVLNGGQSSGITFNDNDGSTGTWNCDDTWHYSTVETDFCATKIKYVLTLKTFNANDEKVHVQYSAACEDNSTTDGTVDGIEVVHSDLSVEARESCGVEYEPVLDFGTVVTNGPALTKVLVSSTTGTGHLAITSAGQLDGTQITLKSGENSWIIDALQDGNILSMSAGDIVNSNAALDPISLRTHTAPAKAGKYQGTAVLTVTCD